MSLGEDRVRVKFVTDMAAAPLVVQIKQNTAHLIDLCERHKQANADKPNGTGEVHRLYSLAQTAYEEAAMWAVKAATA